MWIWVLAVYEGERFATQEALLSDFYIRLEFHVFAILIPRDGEIFDKLGHIPRIIFSSSSKMTPPPRVRLGLIN